MYGALFSSFSQTVGPEVSAVYAVLFVAQSGELIAACNAANDTSSDNTPPGLHWKGTLEHTSRLSLLLCLAGLG